METHFKTCRACLRVLPIDAYHINNYLPDKHHNYCKNCRSYLCYQPISLLLEAKLRRGERYNPPVINNPSYGERIALLVAEGSLPIDDAIFLFSNTIAGRNVKVTFLSKLLQWKVRDFAHPRESLLTY